MSGYPSNRELAVRDELGGALDGVAYQVVRLLTVSRKVLRHSAKSAGGLHGTFKEVLEIHQPSFPPLESRLVAFLSKAPCAVGWRDSPARSLDAEVVARRRVARGKSHDKLSRMR